MKWILGAFRHWRLVPCGAAMFLAVGSPAVSETAADLYTASLPPAHRDQRPALVHPERTEGRMMVLGFAGDVGFSGNGDRPSAEGSVKHGRIIPWEHLTRTLAPLLAADANFANLETVISAREDLEPIEKSFTFRGHPEALRRTISAGFSVLTAANNHAGDFGPDGIVETLGALADAREMGLRASAGLGIGQARYQPATFGLGGTQIGVAAIGLAINHAGPDGPGQPLYASQQDFDRVLSGLASTRSDIRVLSVHYGPELVSLPGGRDTRRFRKAIDEGDAHIIFGHHSHVASGAEFRNGGLILYGLGNFMHSGTQDMSRYGACRDFGIYAKVYLWVVPGAAPVIRALEVFPLRGMHAVPEALPVTEAAGRIAILNALNAVVTEPGSAPIRFETTSRGSGLACFGSQSGFSDQLTARCTASRGPRQEARLITETTLATCQRTAPEALSAKAQPRPPIPEPRPPKRVSLKKGSTSAEREARASTVKLLD